MSQPLQDNACRFNPGGATLPEHIPENNPENKPYERGTHRHRSYTKVLVIRDSDIMQFGLQGDLKDVSQAGLGVVLDNPLDIGEHVKVDVEHIVQRFKKQVRGIVRHVMQMENQHRIGIELFTRLTPLDVSILKMGAPKDDDQDSHWLA